MTAKINSFAASGTNLYAGTDNGIYLSTDKGASWTGLTNTSTNEIVVKSNGTNGINIFATLSDTAVYLSADSCKTWTRVFHGGYIIVNHLVTASFVTALSIKDSSVFMGMYNGPYNYFYRSTNNGATWDSLDIKEPSNLNGFGLPGLAVIDSSILASDGINLYRSTDNGASWATIPNGFPKNSFGNPTVYSFAVEGNSLFACTVVGIFSSTDKGTSWTLMNKGLNVSAANPLTVYGENIFFAGSNGYYLFRSTDNGSTWSTLNDSIYYQYSCIAVNGSNILVGTDGPREQAGISPSLLSSNNGTSWIVNINSYAANYAHCYGINNAFYFMGVAYGGIGVLRCPIDSSTWSDVSNSQMGPVYCIAVNDSNIYAATRGQGISYSSDNGSQWTSISNGFDESACVTTIVVNGSTLFAGTSTDISQGILSGKGIFRSTDNGEIWALANNGLTANNINDIAIHDQKVFVGTDSNGIFLSTDNGASWHSLNDGLPNMNIASLAVNDTFVYAGITGGLWRMPISEAITSVSHTHQDLPLHFSLGQNYPNPFNPTTTISFALPSRSLVTLKVFDLLGREVATIVSGEMSAGNYSKQWNASKFASGVYFYRLEAGSYTETKKLLLLK